MDDRLVDWNHGRPRKVEGIGLFLLDCQGGGLTHPHGVSFNFVSTSTVSEPSTIDTSVESLVNFIRHAAVGVERLHQVSPIP